MYGGGGAKYVRHLDNDPLDAGAGMLAISHDDDDDDDDDDMMTMMMMTARIK